MRKIGFGFLVCVLVLLRAINGVDFGTVQILMTCAVWGIVTFAILYRKRISAFILDASEKGKKAGKKIFDFEKSEQAHGLTDKDRIDMNHAWMRINEKLKAVFPDATWAWSEETLPKIEKLLLSGGAGYIKTTHTGEFNCARVDLDRQSRMAITMIKMEPLDSFSAKKKEEQDKEAEKKKEEQNKEAESRSKEVACAEAESKQEVYTEQWDYNTARKFFEAMLAGFIACSKPMNKKAEVIPEQEKNIKKWYHETAHRIVDETIADLRTRGYSRLYISESGNVYILEDGKKKIERKIENMPERGCWDLLLPLLQQDGRTAEIAKRRICLNWSK